jgi:hypothetical protein
LSNVIQFVLIGGLAILLGAVVINLNVIDSKLNTLESSVDLSLVESKLGNLETGLNYLYASETNLTTSFEERKGKFPSASYTNELNTMIITTNNKTNLVICKLFLHELGHKVCYSNKSEECANEYRENNLFRCEGLE